MVGQKRKTHLPVGNADMERFRVGGWVDRGILVGGVLLGVVRPIS